ncbi:MAG: acyl-CoA thioesterase [Clostridiales bacterium]|nr:acyl-CoA thioesterase [Clostridiales bacterium]
MSEYIRPVYYHETDKMGITHHSNYVKWLEEARIDLLGKAGASYAELEKRGLSSPVVELSVRYKAPTSFGDTVKVEVKVKEYNGIKLAFDYTVTNLTDGKVATVASSSHCFLSGGKIVNLARTFPDVDKLMRDYIENNK